MKENYINKFNAIIKLSDEVGEALADGAPVVALESSIIAQGFPAPDNAALATEMLEIVRNGGAFPAMIAVIGGRVKIGLDGDDLDALVSGRALKCSARDLAFAVAESQIGATTVAATARIAGLVGIRVFATGGIGGIHPGENALDISADLLELTQAPVAVVCSGAKSILDLPKTFEALETLGIPVIGYNCREFPAFHAAESGLPLSQTVDDVQRLGEILAAHWSLAGRGGALICNPPPANTAIARDELDNLVSRAQAEAENEGIRGAALTPFLLQRLNLLSDGRTLAVNRALALANAKLAAALAVACTQGAGNAS